MTNLEKLFFVKDDGGILKNLMRNLKQSNEHFHLYFCNSNPNVGRIKCHNFGRIFCQTFLKKLV